MGQCKSVILPKTSGYLIFRVKLFLTISKLNLSFTAELPPQSQLEATKALIKTGIKEGYIRPDYKLVGHKQVMATECPGGALYQHISTWDHFVPEFVEMKH